MWINQHDGGPHEANFLKLDGSKIKNIFGWKAQWNIDTAMEKTIEVYLCCHTKGNVASLIRKQTEDFCGLKKQVEEKIS